MSRDFTVFTINWFGYAVRLVPGSSYVNRAYYFISELGNVEATANDLMEKTYATQINNEDWSPRMVGIYSSSKDDGYEFTIVTASSVRGNSTKCDNPLASLICSGTSTPSPGRVPFFYVRCGTSLEYFGTDPYHFTPPFGSRFPGHGNINNMVRSYVCDKMDISVRPDWKIMGFFNSSDTGCLSLVQARYNSAICVANETAVPSLSPTSRLSIISTKPTSGASTFAEKKKKSISKSGKSKWQLKALKQIKSIRIKSSFIKPLPFTTTTATTTATTTITTTTTKPTTQSILYRERTRMQDHYQYQSKVDSRHFTRGKAQ